MEYPHGGFKPHVDYYLSVGIYPNKLFGIYGYVISQHKQKVIHYMCDGQADSHVFILKKPGDHYYPFTLQILLLDNMYRIEYIKTKQSPQLKLLNLKS